MTQACVRLPRLIRWLADSSVRVDTHSHLKIEKESGACYRILSRHQLVLSYSRLSAAKQDLQARCRAL